MKQILFAVMIGCITAIALSAETRRPKECQSICTMQYDPICASAPGETPKSFGNVCVMKNLKNYNCENNKNLSVISEDECPGGGSIRLS